MQETMQSVAVIPGKYKYDDIKQSLIDSTPAAMGTSFNHKILAIVTMAVVATSCGGSGDTSSSTVVGTATLDTDTCGESIGTDASDVPIDAPLCWQLGPVVYGEGADVAQWQVSGVEVVTATDYAGSKVTVQLSGSGTPVGDDNESFGVSRYTYTVVDNIDGGSGTAFIAVTAGSAQEPLASSRWLSTTGQISVKRVFDDTREFYSTLYLSTPDRLTLTRELGWGSGVTDSLEEIYFKIQNLNGENLCGDSGRWC